ncbi:hypothetical protein [Escherichia phage vB_EcoM_IME392]|nr:hypothetical protein [Escherichia phage vB_EcoM_IME392]
MSLSYDELVESFLLESGQFILDSLDDTALTQDRVELIIAKELATYSRYKPNLVTGALNLWNNRRFTGKDEHGNPEPIPIVIHRLFVNGGFTRLITNNRFGTISQNYWRFDNGVFNMYMEDGQYLCEYAVAHTYNKETKSIDSLDLTATTFMSMVHGKMMQVLGRSRRAFQISDSPILMDGDALIADGQQMYDQAMEDLKTQSDYMLASM